MINESFCYMGMFGNLKTESFLVFGIWVCLELGKLSRGSLVWA